MTAIPLPKGFTAVSDFPKLRETLINLFNTGEGLIRTPGIEDVATTAGATRGSVFFKNRLYKVFGTSLTRIDPDETLTVVGTIPGTAQVRMEPGFVFISIIVVGGDGFTFDESGGLIQITDAQFVLSSDVAVIKGITVYTPSDGDPLLFSEPNLPGTIAGFIDAEDLPDINTGVFNFNNDLHALGEDSIQIFRNPAGATVSQPLFPVSGSTAQVGYLSAATLYAPSFAFIGKERKQSYSIRIMGQGRAPRISNPAVDEFLNTEYTTAELQQAVGSSYEWKGYPVLCFRLARHTLCYMGGNWFFQESGINGANSPGPWTGNYITFAYGRYYVGDATQSRLGKLEDIATEYGEKLEYSFDTFVRAPRDSDFTINNAELDCLTGQATPEGTIGLTVSTDGRIWQTDNTIWRPLGKVGQYGLRVAWNMPGGLGTYESFAGLRIRSTANVDFSLESFDVDI